MAFVHDELDLEIPVDSDCAAHTADIERLMITGMQVVVPGANVRVETSVRRSFSKVDVVDEATWRRVVSGVYAA